MGAIHVGSRQCLRSLGIDAIKPRPRIKVADLHRFETGSSAAVNSRADNRQNGLSILRA